jgi:xanthine dehydrogenase accessory factor
LFLVRWFSDVMHELRCARAESPHGEKDFSMKELLRITAALRASASQPAVLATLVKAEGSSYRRTGARLLLRDPLARIGSISGGCLEEDIAAHAASVLTTGRVRTLVYDTTGENDLVWGAGLGCHGIVHVLLERVIGVPPSLAFVTTAWEAREAVVLATVFRHDQVNAEEVATPQGAVFAASESGRVWRAPAAADVPTAALGVRSERLEEQALAVLKDQKDQQSRTVILHDAPGAPEVFFEYLPPPPVLTIFGAGDDVGPLARLAAELGWLVTIVDSRPAYATAARFPTARAVHVAPPAEAVARAALDARALVVVMTHRYLDDLPLLRDLLTRPLAYLGLLGPKKRAEKILADLARDGVVLTASDHVRLYAPVGLDLGGSTPEEVALAILAEIQAVRSARDARPLRERTRPIHHE